MQISIVYNPKYPRQQAGIFFAKTDMVEDDIFDSVFQKERKRKNIKESFLFLQEESFQ